MKDSNTETDIVFSLLEMVFTNIGTTYLDSESYSALLQCGKSQLLRFKTGGYRLRIKDLVILANAIEKCFFEKIDEKYSQSKMPKIYITNVHLSTPEVKPKEKVVVGIAEIKLNFEEFFQKTEVDFGQLYELKVKKVDEMIDKYVNAIEILEKDQKLDIVCFPELMCPPVNKLAPIFELAKKYDLYIIAGSYHNIGELSNEAVIISPDGTPHFQKKFLKSDDEGIKPTSWGYLKVFDSKIGRFVVPICLDLEHEELAPLLTRMRNRCNGVDFIFNPSFHKAPERAKSRLINLSEDIMAVGVFVNGHRKGGSFIFDLSKEFFGLKKDVLVKVINVKSIRDDRKQNFPCRVSS